MIRTGYQNFVRTAIVAYTDIKNRLKLLETDSIKNEKNHTEMQNKLKFLQDEIISLKNELQNTNANVKEPKCRS